MDLDFDMAVLRRQPLEHYGSATDLNSSSGYGSSPTATAYRRAEHFVLTPVSSPLIGSTALRLFSGFKTSTPVDK